LAELRAEQAHFRGLSFETISAVGANGATIHYRPGGGVTDPAVTTQEMYLCDSGAQYLDGTMTKSHYNLQRDWYHGSEIGLTPMYTYFEHTLVGIIRNEQFHVTETKHTP